MKAPIFLLFFLFPLISIATPDPQPTFDIRNIYDHENTGCMPKEIADGLIEKYKVDIASFGGLELCAPHHPTRVLLLSLFMVDQGRFDGVNKRDRLPSDIPAYVSSRIRTIRAGDCGRPALACADNGTIQITETFSKTSSVTNLLLPLAYTSAAIIHEVRHFDGYQHVEFCQVGRQRGDYQCEFFSSGGAFSVEIEYFLRVAEHGLNFDPRYQISSLSSGNDLLQYQIVDSPPPLPTQHILLKEQDADQATLWDGRALKQTLSLPSGASLFGAGPFRLGAISLSQGANPQILYFGIDGLRLFSYPFKTGEPKIGRFERELGLRHYLEQKEGGVLPLESLDRIEASVALYADRIEYLSDAKESVWKTSGLPAGEQAVGISQTLPCYSPEGLVYDGIYVHMKSTTIFQATINAQDQIQFRPLVCRWPQHFRQVESFNGNLVALDAQGRFYTWKPGNVDVKEILQGEDAKRRFEKLTKINWAFTRDTLTH